MYILVYHANGGSIKRYDHRGCELPSGYGDLSGELIISLEL